MILNPEAMPFEHDDRQRMFRLRQQQHYPFMSHHMDYYHGPPPLPLLPPPPPPHFQRFQHGGLFPKPSSSSQFYHPFYHQHKSAAVAASSSVHISTSTPPPPLPLPNHYHYHHQMMINYGTASSTSTRNNTSYPFNYINGGGRRMRRRRRSLSGQNWKKDQTNIRTNAAAGTSNNGVGGTGVYWRKKFTSLMIRNIPNRLSREKLMEMVDQHCVEENKKAQEEGESSSHGSCLLSEYDFLYLPMDFRKKLNLGYAFVNFTSSVAASRFTRSFEDYKWEVFQTTKICKICPARIQGRDRLVGRFKNSCFKCDTDDYLPVVFSPPRNGSTSLTPPSLVGSRSSVGY